MKKKIWLVSLVGLLNFLSCSEVETEPNEMVLDDLQMNLRKAYFVDNDSRCLIGTTNDGSCLSHTAYEFIITDGYLSDDSESIVNASVWAKFALFSAGTRNYLEGDFRGLAEGNFTILDDFWMSDQTGNNVGWLSVYWMDKEYTHYYSSKESGMVTLKGKLPKLTITLDVQLTPNLYTPNGVDPSPIQLTGQFTGHFEERITW